MWLADWSLVVCREYVCKHSKCTHRVVVELVQCKPVCVAHFTVSVLFSEQVCFPHQFTRRFFEYSYTAVISFTSNSWQPPATTFPLFNWLAGQSLTTLRECSFANQFHNNYQQLVWVDIFFHSDWSLLNSHRRVSQLVWLSSYLVLSCKQDHYWLQKGTCTQYTNDKLQNADQETQLYMTHHLVCTILTWELYLWPLSLWVKSRFNIIYLCMSLPLHHLWCHWVLRQRRKL